MPHFFENIALPNPPTPKRSIATPYQAYHTPTASTKDADRGVGRLGVYRVFILRNNKLYLNAYVVDDLISSEEREETQNEIDTYSVGNHHVLTTNSENANQSSVGQVLAITEASVPNFGKCNGDTVAMSPEGRALEEYRFLGN
ncbi:hypothetical protein EVAR_68208_1 [Eumeta japonica]|uniref:Uncharacterized protein n=1 Tax=Eumeta variegata TaxID=151549 RepID=A0A4C2A7D0_EUMVA|nr:hypothetical protein EVAR_68208_1 [Eumeta japonica]